MIRKAWYNRNMTIENLQKKQEEMHEKIVQHAAEHGLIKQKPFLKPICDGVADIKGYLSSNPKIMWFLKEPHDDFTANGDPKGGEWSFTEYFKNIKLQPRQVMLKLIIQINYAIHNNLDWKDILLEQIRLYAPDIIIFGYTFKFLKEDFQITEKPISTVSGQWNTDAYKKDNMILIDAYHPSRKGGEDGSYDYVTSIVKAVRKLL